MAACFFKSTYAAHVAHVSVDARKQIKVERITAVLDCGTVVNPDGVRAQIEGAIMDGIATVFGLEITLREGRIEQSNFDRYRWATMSVVPEIDIHIVPSPEPPGGAGEPPYPSVAPAITNAIFNAVGVRVRKLPIRWTLA